MTTLLPILAAASCLAVPIPSARPSPPAAKQPSDVPEKVPPHKEGALFHLLTAPLGSVREDDFEHVHHILKQAGIDVEGWMGRGHVSMFVHKEDAVRAKRILQADAAEHHYYVFFSYQPPAQKNGTD